MGADVKESTFISARLLYHHGFYISPDFISAWYDVIINPTMDNDVIIIISHGKLTVSHGADMWFIRPIMV